LAALLYVLAIGADRCATSTLRHRVALRRAVVADGHDAHLEWNTDCYHAPEHAGSVEDARCAIISTYARTVRGRA
jgi:hypothetical protein